MLGETDRRGVGTDVVSFDGQDVMEVPGAVDNVFRALQTLPGVAATSEFGSSIAVQGGAPEQNLVIMDGVEIYNPYRLFGLSSAFNPQTVDHFELSRGAFETRFGDRLSSVLVVDNRLGTSEKLLQGSAGVSITDANLVLEGKLPPWLLAFLRSPDLLRFHHQRSPPYDISVFPRSPNESVLGARRRPTAFCDRSTGQRKKEPRHRQVG